MICKLLHSSLFLLPSCLFLLTFSFLSLPSSLFLVLSSFSPLLSYHNITLIRSKRNQSQENVMRTRCASPTIYNIFHIRSQQDGLADADVLPSLHFSQLYSSPMPARHSSSHSYHSRTPGSHANGRQRATELSPNANRSKPLLIHQTDVRETLTNEDSHKRRRPKEE
jgi:hypothetical protein